MTMTEEESQLQRDIEKIKADVERVRDELRLHLHLGAMDVRDTYRELESEADRIGSAVTQASKHAWRSLLVRLQTLTRAVEDATTPPASH
jgi:hypothetical protein